MNIINTTFPFPEDKLEEFIDSKEIYFNIDFDSSELKENKFLNYFYNCGINGDITSNKIDNDFKELVIFYLKTNKIINIPLLNNIICIILLNNITENNLLEKNSDILEIYNANKEIFNELQNILFSLKSLLIKIIVENKSDDENQIVPDNKFKYIGQNFISLRNSPLFWEVLKNLNNVNSTDIQYEELYNFSFDGKKAIYYFLNEFNPFTASIITLENKKK